MEKVDFMKSLKVKTKASLCSGADFWYTKGVKSLHLPGIMITDGPHGLRKQAGSADHLGINQSLPATCFPPACATACSFNTELMWELGTALAEECLQEGVSVLLGPGMNIKRSPLCGRNFEYISEDPFLTGEMASALITGLQGMGIGACPKHFAANNQEYYRMYSDSVIDERALREIYLAAFETVVKKAGPWAIMSSYNKVNGTYVGENKRLLTKILRDEWKYEGTVISDWGAVSNRVRGLAAGMDLEMPSSGRYNDGKIVKAIKKGDLPEEALNASVFRIIKMLEKAEAAKQHNNLPEQQEHHELARKAAAQSAVLLKNEQAILPFKKNQTIALLGRFAKEPRYQGAGSSRINPIKLDCAYEALEAEGIHFEYSEGYPQGNAAFEEDDLLLKKACAVAKDKDIALVFAGLPDEMEGEGQDRADLSMPETHNRLIEAVASVNPNTVVVLQLGSPVEMPWLDRVKGVLVAYLGGEAGGTACVDILTGAVNPSGKLAETWPEKVSDVPCYNYFPGGSNSVQYRESIFVGYRFYDRTDIAPAFPFGFGLSYTTFAYSALAISENSVACVITNTGEQKGAEVAQLYIGLDKSVIFRAQKELRGFLRVELKPGESKKVEFPINRHSFAYYNVKAAQWAVEDGDYTISIGSSSRDIRLSGTLYVAGDGLESNMACQQRTLPGYYKTFSAPFMVPDEEFYALHGGTIPSLDQHAGAPFSMDSTLNDIKDTKIGQIIIKLICTQAGNMLSGIDLQGMSLEESVLAMTKSIPVRTFAMMAGDSLNLKMLEGILDIANGKMVRGMAKIVAGKLTL